MASPTDPLRNAERLAALADTDLPNSAAEEAFDRLTRTVTRLLGVPVALVSLVDDTRQFFKSQQDPPSPVSDARQPPLTYSFCQHVVIDREPLVVTDAENDPRVCDNRFPALCNLTKH